MNLKAQRQHSMSFSRRTPFIALALTSLYGTASTLSSVIVLSLVAPGIAFGAEVKQTGETLLTSNPSSQDATGNLPSDYRAQLPSLPPPPETVDPFPPNNQAPAPPPLPPDTQNPEGVNPYAPIPPLGYPEQPLEVTPAQQFDIYRLGVGDAIAVTVPRFPDLNFQGTINLEGEVVVPLVGKVKLANLTLEGAESVIRQGLNRFVVDPEVVVSLTGTRPAQITISGEVFRPGYYTLAPGSQLSTALVTAGGTTNEADLRTVVVRRRSLVDNSINELQIDLFTPLQNGTNLPELRLQDGDAVIVAKMEVGTDEDYDRRLVSRSSVAQPQINIRVLSYANERIGNVALPNGSTFVDALAAIAPNPDQARLRNIALIRFDPETGKAVTQRLNGKSALMGDVSQNVPLQNNDVIVVGRSLIARITYGLDLITQPIRSVLGFQGILEELSNLGGGDDDNDD